MKELFVLVNVRPTIVDKLCGIVAIVGQTGALMSLRDIIVGARCLLITTSQLLIQANAAHAGEGSDSDQLGKIVVTTPYLTLFFYGTRETTVDTRDCLTAKELEIIFYIYMT